MAPSRRAAECLGQGARRRSGRLALRRRRRRRPPRRRSIRGSASSTACASSRRSAGTECSTARSARRKGEEGVPSTQMLRYLRRVDDVTKGGLRWGMLTNGRHWRLYFQGALSVAEDFLEIDLGKVLRSAGLRDRPARPAAGRLRRRCRVACARPQALRPDLRPRGLPARPSRRDLPPACAA